MTVTGVDILKAYFDSLPTIGIPDSNYRWIKYKSCFIKPCSTTPLYGSEIGLILLVAFRDINKLYFPILSYIYNDDIVHVGPDSAAIFAKGWPTYPFSNNGGSIRNLPVKVITQFTNPDWPELVLDYLDSIHSVMTIREDGDGKSD